MLFDEVRKTFWFVAGDWQPPSERLNSRNSTPRSTTEQNADGKDDSDCRAMRINTRFTIIADKCDGSETSVHAAVYPVLRFLISIIGQELRWPAWDKRERSKRILISAAL